MHGGILDDDDLVAADRRPLEGRLAAEEGDVAVDDVAVELVADLEREVAEARDVVDLPRRAPDEVGAAGVLAAAVEEEAHEPVAVELLDGLLDLEDPRELEREADLVDPVAHVPADRAAADVEHPPAEEVRADAALL